MDFEVALLEATLPPIYQRIAERALHLQQLGVSDSAIARRLGVTDKTVRKAIGWIRGVPPQPRDQERLP